MRRSEVKAAFARWAEKGAELHDKRLRVNGTVLPLWDAQGMLVCSKDCMPDAACKGLNVPAGSTYSDGVVAAAQKADDELAAMFRKDGPFGEALRAVGQGSGPEAIRRAADLLADELSLAVVNCASRNGGDRTR